MDKSIDKNSPEVKELTHERYHEELLRLQVELAKLQHTVEKAIIRNASHFVGVDSRRGFYMAVHSIDVE